MEGLKRATALHHELGLYRRTPGRPDVHRRPEEAEFRGKCHDCQHLPCKPAAGAAMLAQSDKERASLIVQVYPITVTGSGMPWLAHQRNQDDTYCDVS